MEKSKKIYPDGEAVSLREMIVHNTKIFYGVTGNTQSEIYHVFRIEGEEYEIYSLYVTDIKRKPGSRFGMKVHLHKPKPTFPPEKKALYEMIVKEVIESVQGNDGSSDPYFEYR